MKPSEAPVAPLGADELARRRRVRELAAQQRRLLAITRALASVARHDAYLRGQPHRHPYETRDAA